MVTPGRVAKKPDGVFPVAFAAAAEPTVHGVPQMGSLRIALDHQRDTSVCPSDQHALVRLVGQLDLESAPQLSAELEELVEERVRHVVVDLSALEYMDSVGLSLVLAEHERVESLGGELIIFSPCSQVRSLFEEMGLHDRFNVRPPKAAVLA
jgi:anti-sigma B factor antagonist